VVWQARYFSPSHPNLSLRAEANDRCLLGAYSVNWPRRFPYSGARIFHELHPHVTQLDIGNSPSIVENLAVNDEKTVWEDARAVRKVTYRDRASESLRPATS
jgi:hypothetical protein